MAYTGSAIEKMERLVPCKAEKAVKLAYKEARNAGQSIVMAAAGKLYQVSPDGKRKFIKDLAKRVQVKKGAKFRIR